MEKGHLSQFSKLDLMLNLISSLEIKKGVSGIKLLDSLPTYMT